MSFKGSSPNLASDVEQKILGRLAHMTAYTSPFLSRALHQVLGLSVMLSKKLRRARKLRRLDPSRDTKSLQLYHHILWLSREGLAIVELDVLPYTQNGEQGAECRIMSCKLRASFYHIFCLFHNNPPVSTLSIPSQITLYSDPDGSPQHKNGQRRSSNGKNGSSRHGKKASLRDAIPSLQSDISYITNPYALTGATPPPQSQHQQQTPSRPPGLPPKPQIPSSTAFILPPLNFLPITTSAFTTASSLASSLLPGSHPLRLSVALEHSAFLWDCAKEFDRSRRVAHRAISDVWKAEEGMDDMEFADARELVSLLGGMMKRGLPKSNNGGSTTEARRTGSEEASSRARSGGTRTTAEDVDAARRGNEGAWFASASSSPAAKSAAPFPRRSPPKESRSSPPQRQTSSGASSAATPKPAPFPPRSSSLRNSPARQDRNPTSNTPPRSATSSVQTARRSPPQRQTSHGTASSTPRPPTAIRDSPHLRPPTATREKELPPTPEEWSRVGYLGEPRPASTRRGTQQERSPLSVTTTPTGRGDVGASSSSRQPATPQQQQQRTPPGATRRQEGHQGSSGGSSHVSPEVRFQTPSSRSPGNRLSGGGGAAASGSSGPHSGGSGSRSAGSTSSNTRGGSAGQRGSGGSAPREASSSQTTTPRSGSERHSGESGRSPGSATPRGTSRGGGRFRLF
ncbi:MAG: hypothetical protein M1821_003376 [Bathelium mastoideum]|nr:MAG: hypothetical protein M1821_003376 [Bathelium mastoideum]